MTNPDPSTKQDRTGSENSSGTVTILLRVLFVSLFVALLGRLFYLQVLQADNYRDLQEQQTHVTKREPAPRGTIHDRKNRIIATSITRFSVFADPKLVEDVRATARKLSNQLNVPEGELLEKLNREEDRFVWVKRKLKRQQIQFLRNQHIKGIGVRPEQARSYPHGNVAPHVIGFVGEGRRGLAGVEHSFDNLLAGKPGTRLFWRDGKNDLLYARSRMKEEPEPGDDLSVTIDVELQRIAREEFKKTKEKYRPNWGSLLVMEPDAGEVLALVNYPSFSLKNFEQSDENQRRNRALTDPVEPGSVFKPLVMAAALEERVIQRGDTIYCENGRYHYRGRELHDYTSFGRLTITEILSRSSNIGMAKIGIKLEDKLRQWVLSFGFGKKTGIQLPGEDAGHVQDTDSWNPIYTQTSVPMGHEILATPLQVTGAFCALANGGKLVKPVIVRDDGEQQARQEKRILTRATTRKVLSMMRKVVTEGTGTRAQSDYVDIAGKTGTSMKYSDQDKYLSVFVGVAPYPDPDLVVAAFVDEPKGEHTGGRVAAPVVRRVIERASAYLNGSGLQVNNPKNK